MPLYCMSSFEQIHHIKKAIITSIPFFCIVGINLPHKYVCIQLLLPFDNLSTMNYSTPSIIKNHVLVQYCPYNNRVLVQKVAGIFGLTNINQHFCTYKYIHCPETANTGHALEVGKTWKTDSQHS